MSAVVGFIAKIIGPLLGPLALYLLKAWIERQGAKNELLRAYYAFMEAIERHASVDVENYLAASDARADVLERIKRERLAREEAAKNGNN